MVLLNISLFLIFFITIYLLLILGVEKKDDSGKVITGLLPFFVSLSFFLSGTLVFLINDTSIKETKKTIAISKKKTQDSPIKKLTLPFQKKESNKSQKYISFDSWVNFGTLILVITFFFSFLRRAGQSSLLVEAIAAWNKLDIDNSEEVLIKHGIEKPEDRDWITDIIKVKHKYYEKEKTDDEQKTPVLIQTEEH